jgi:subtilisin family serine protease
MLQNTIMRFAALSQLLPVVAAIVARPLPPTSRELKHTYIIKFGENTTSSVQQSHIDWIRSLVKRHESRTIELRHVFSLGFNGYSAVLDLEALDAVRYSPEVVEISHVGLSETPSNLSEGQSRQPEAVGRLSADPVSPVAANGLITVPNKGWNFNRLSHREFKKGYENGPWIRDQYLGGNASVYILDTGINLAQPGFKGSQVFPGKNFVRTSQRGATNDDVHGHGTMCAGVVAGKNGVAPEAKTYAVKIANDKNQAACDDTVAGIEWVINQPGPNNMKVLSMSQTGFTGQPDVSSAVKAAVLRGVHFVVSAGNNGVDACGVEPSNAPGAIVVGSVDAFNRLPIKGKDDLEGTNIGRCITVFAPGSKVPSLSAKDMSSNYYYWGWGTSIAAPQVAAVIANRLSAVGAQRPAQIKAWIQGTATKGQVEGDLKGAPNLIAFTGPGAEILAPVTVDSNEKKTKTKTKM